MDRPPQPVLSLALRIGKLLGCLRQPDKLKGRKERMMPSGASSTDSSGGGRGNGPEPFRQVIHPGFIDSLRHGQEWIVGRLVWMWHHKRLMAIVLLINAAMLGWWQYNRHIDERMAAYEVERWRGGRGSYCFYCEEIDSLTIVETGIDRRTVSSISFYEPRIWHFYVSDGRDGVRFAVPKDGGRLRVYGNGQLYEFELSDEGFPQRFKNVWLKDRTNFKQRAIDVAAQLYEGPEKAELQRLADEFTLRPLTEEEWQRTMEKMRMPPEQRVEQILRDLED
jgi:hypothetical protein